MTPREVDELSNDELEAFQRYMRDELRATKRAQDKARARGRRR